jgi:integrase
MARVKDLWTATVKGPDGRPVKKHTGRHGKGKRWLAVWTGEDGREASAAFAKKSDAERYGAAQETDTLRGVGIDPKAARVTVAQWCDTWLTGYATRRESTVKAARVHISQIKAEFGGLQLGAVRPSHVKTWTSRLAAEGAAPSYVHSLHGRLSQILGDAVHDGLLAKSPCSRRTSPGAAKQRAYVATTEQVWALYEAVPEHIGAAVLLGAFAGLRVAEACGLRPGDVDFMRGVIRPAVQYPAEPLKTEMSRTAVPIAQSMALELAAHVRRHPGPAVLVNAGGVQLGPWAVERAVRAARGKVDGLPGGFRFHDLRHYFASLLIADGCDVKTVQARLRHASAKTTLDTYGHLWPDRDESTRAAVEAVFLARTEQERNRALAP